MKFDHVTKAYGTYVVLDAFTLDVRPYEITAVLGESGSGKTTLLNVAAGLTDFDGQADFGRCAYVFQDACLLPHLSVAENLRFALPKEAWDGIPAMLARVGLGDKSDRTPAHLSGGEKKRVSLARALLFPHDTLLLDEPFSSLDLALRREMLSLVAELSRERHDTVLFVTHDVREAAVLADRAVVMKQGRVAADLPITDPRPRDFFTPLPVEAELVRALVGEA